MQAVLFDLGNVMIHVHMDRMTSQIGEVLGRSSVEINDLLLRDDLQKRYETGLLNDDEMFAALVAHSTKPVDRQELEYAAANIFSENSDMLPILDELAAADVELAIVSNTNGIHIRLAEQRFACFEYFTNRIYSHEVKAMKPHRRYYEIVAERIATKDPSQCLFVDDLADNIAGARDFGFRGHQFENAQALRYELVELGLLK